MEDNKISKYNRILYSLVIVLLTPIVYGAVIYFLKYSITEALSGAIIGALIGFWVNYVYSRAIIRQDFEKSRVNSTGFFLLFYVLGIVSCAASIFVSPLCLPILAFVVFSTVFANEECGISNLVACCTLLYLNSSVPVICFIYIFVTGLLAIFIFNNPQKPFKYVVGSFIVLFLSVSCFAAFLVFDLSLLSINIILNAAIGVVVNFIILIIVLRNFSKKYLEAFDEIYSNINDPEYPLLQRLKEENKDEYYLAVHSAYLCNKIATLLGRDTRLCKCGAYYNHINVLFDDGRTSAEIISGEDFPMAAVDIVRQCQNSAKVPPIKGEAVICIFAYDVVGSIRYMLKQNQNETPNYDKIIEFIFKKKTASSLINNCDLTMQEITSMKEYFKGEKLYYDFLR